MNKYSELRDQIEQMLSLSFYKRKSNLNDETWVTRAGYTRIIVDVNLATKEKLNYQWLNEVKLYEEDHSKVGLFVRIDSILKCGWGLKENKLFALYKISLINEDYMIIKQNYEIDTNEFIVDSNDLLWDSVVKQKLYSYLSNNKTSNDWQNRLTFIRAGTTSRVQ